MSSPPERVEGYASAIFDVAKAEGALEQVEDDLFRFARAMESNDQLRQTLTDQALPVERRQAIVEELLGSRGSPLAAALVSFVVAAGRARDLSAIIDRLVDRAVTERQHVLAEVRSAVHLDDDHRRRLAEALSASLGKQVEVKVVVDPSVMGGVMARIGDTVIDGTVRHRLDQLREAL